MALSEIVLSCCLFWAICYVLAVPFSLFIAAQLWFRLFYNINCVLKASPNMGFKPNTLLVKWHGSF